jgi:hypothetical protein
MPRARGSRGEEGRIARTETPLFPALVGDNHCARDDMGDFVLGVRPLETARTAIPSHNADGTVLANCQHFGSSAWRAF